MIQRFRSKALERLYHSDDARGIRPDLVRRIRQILALLDAAQNLHALRGLGLDLHPLKGDLAGHWSVSVNANWRITFIFRDGNATGIALVDYH
ncbi:MAG: type II toxin-antitoxin system RelE/ParE family toxin [Gemmatimonas sp.]